MRVGRLALAIALSVAVQAVVIATSWWSATRVVAGFDPSGGPYGGPIFVGYVSGLYGSSFRAGLFTFEPWLLLVDFAITLAFVLPMLPVTNPRGVAVGAASGGALAYVVWMLPTALPSAYTTAGPDDWIWVVLADASAPLLWVVLLAGMLGGAYVMRRRERVPHAWSYGSVTVTRMVVAVALAAIIQWLVTQTSMLFPTGDGWYGAPFPVGRSSGLGGALISLGSVSVTFEPWIAAANLMITAAPLFLALPTLRTWTTGVVSLLAILLGFSIMTAMILMAVSRSAFPLFGFPVPAPFEARLLPWVLWGNLMLCALAGVWLWRRRATRPQIRRRNDDAAARVTSASN